MSGWLSQLSVGLLISAQVVISRSGDQAPHLTLLDIAEPAWDSPFPSATPLSKKIFFSILSFLKCYYFRYKWILNYIRLFLCLWDSYTIVLYFVNDMNFIDFEWKISTILIKYSHDILSFLYISKFTLLIFCLGFFISIHERDCFAIFIFCKEIVRFSIS